jgi:osmotically-inducible protein OsmY
MKSDEDLHIDVQAAIKLQQELHRADIDIKVVDAIVILTGTVTSLEDKIVAEKAVEKVAGVKAVSANIDVLPYGFKVKTDDTIKAEVLNIFKLHWDIPDDKVEITVNDGLVILEGKIKWHYQKDAATKATCGIEGVKGVINTILVDKR